MSRPITKKNLPVTRRSKSPAPNPPRSAPPSRPLFLFYIFLSLLALFLLFVLILNFLSPPWQSPASADEFLITPKLQMSSLSLGENYLGRLHLWQSLFLSGHPQAATMEKTLDPYHVSYFRDQYDPDILKKNLNFLVTKEDKNTEDWLEIARLNLRLGKIDETKLALSQAKKLDPIREDIDALYYSFSPTP